MTEYRVKVIEDEYPDFSHLDENEDDYLENGPVMRKRIRTNRPEMKTPKGFSLDLYPFTIIFHPKDAPYEQQSHRVGQWYIIEVHQQWGEPTLRRLALPEEVEMTWDEYRVSYGDQNNYASFGVVIEKQCECCGSWEHVDSCWGFDFYIGDYPYGYGDAAEQWPDSGTYTVEEAVEELPDFMIEHFDVLLGAKQKGAA